ncbi:MAG: endonuclease/exonuclease/phosphatase family protein, partial [Coprobacillaceae bacterium]
VEFLDIRQQQISQLKEALDKDPIEYKIIVGDFNTDQGINEYNAFLDDYQLANGYEGTWLETMKEKDGARDSLETSMNSKFLDNVIVSSNITIKNVKVVKTDLSDHYPLVVELELK